MVKMILEYAQLLSTAHYVPDSDNCEIRNKIYTSTHINHPCAKWERDSHSNYNWLY